MEKMPYRPELETLEMQTFTPAPTTEVVSSDWRQGLPVLSSKQVVLRELRTSDAGLISIGLWELDAGYPASVTRPCEHVAPAPRSLY